MNEALAAGRLPLVQSCDVAAHLLSALKLGTRTDDQQASLWLAVMYYRDCKSACVRVKVLYVRLFELRGRGGGFELVIGGERQSCAFCGCVVVR